MTDDPASLGTEYLEFCSRATANPLNGKKDQPGDLFSVATLAELEFEDQPETLLNKLTDTVRTIFSRKQQSDDARFADVHEAVTSIAERVQTGDDEAEARFTTLENELAALKVSVVTQGNETTQQLSTIKTTLDKTESIQQPRRQLSTGGDAADMTLTDC